MKTTIDIFNALVLTIVLALGVCVVDYIDNNYESFPYERKVK